MPLERGERVEHELARRGLLAAEAQRVGAVDGRAVHAAAVAGALRVALGAELGVLGLAEAREVGQDVALAHPRDREVQVEAERLE